MHGGGPDTLGAATKQLKLLAVKPTSVVLRLY